MNTLLILIVIVVAFSYYGGKNVPSLLRNNKEMLLGVLVGFCLHILTGYLVEGNNDDLDHLIAESEILNPNVHQIMDSERNSVRPIHQNTEMPLVQGGN